jgi:TolB-like protein
MPVVAPQETGQSVAVLPFTNLSASADDAYFADGITEEIIIVLASVPGLRVPARTSCFALRGKNENLRVIGERLGVRHVLEGSVRKADTRLRITTQLTGARGGYVGEASAHVDLVRLEADPLPKRDGARRLQLAENIDSCS